MLSRIRFLFKKKNPSAKLLAVGCLASTRRKTIQDISDEIEVLDNDLASLCKAMKISSRCFSPKIIPVKAREHISILPVSTGCLGSCTYCAAHLARKDLHSYPVEEISRAFAHALLGSKEIWLTSQDLGCYGFDIGSSLPKLLRELLKTPGSYRIRLGMMNPDHFKKIRAELMPLFKDERLYRFLHLPVQSGSNRILKKMGRHYKSGDFAECIRYARAKVPEITISTDVILGFPGETEGDFQKTLSIISRTKPDVLNIARFGKRPGTVAAKLLGQLSEAERKKRSRIVSEFSAALFLEKNKSLVGKEFSALVSERARNGFTARTQNYRPVFVSSGFGEFARVRIDKAYPNFFKGTILSTEANS